MKASIALRQYALPILGLALLSTFVRPPVPLDETRYLAVAWEMWLNHDWLVPHLNGSAYSQKPPLLFWLINLGWQVFGVNEWWPRILPALAAWLSLGLTVKIANRLMSPESGRIAIALVFGTFAWPLYSTALLFDMLMVSWTLLGWLGILRAAQKERWGWLMTALAIGLGVLTKGPVILLYILPAGLLAPLFISVGQRGIWYLKLLLSTLAGAAIALAWVLPAASHGGQAYADDILWGQTAGRMKNSFSHDHPWWWYFPIVLALFLPWSLWPGFWKRLRPSRNMCRIHAFLIAACALPFAIFCLMSGKQPHYLLPLMPLTALAVAMHPNMPTISLRFLRLKWLAPSALFIGLLILPSIFLSPFQIEDLAGKIHELQSAGNPVIHSGKYHGDFNFLGRLEKPVLVRNDRRKLLKWAKNHQDGYFLFADTSEGETPLYTPSVLQIAEHTQPYRSGNIYLISVAKALAALERDSE